MECLSPPLRFAIRSRFTSCPKSVHPVKGGRRFIYAAVNVDTSQAAAETSASASEKDAAALVSSLREVFRSGRSKDLEWRGEQLRGMKRMLKERHTDIFDAVHQDLRRNWQETFMELNAVENSLDHVLKHYKQWAAPTKVGTKPILRPASSFIAKDPFGVALILGAWNYPFSLTLDPLAGALSAGNVAVLKPSELSPASSACLAHWLPVYVDSEAVRVVEGGVAEAEALLQQRWDKIFFTGGPGIGKVVMAAASRNLTPVTLELGGKNPVYVDGTADLAVSARRIIQGRCLNAGQVCLSPDYVLVQEEVADRLVEVLQSTLLQFYGSDPSLSPDLARIVSDRQVARVAALLSHPATASCIVHGGQIVPTTRYVAPTLLRDVPWDAPIMQEECFAPLLAVQTVRSASEAIDIITAREKPLVLHLYSTDDHVLQRFLHETSSGALLRNECIMHFVNEELPFGGVGNSGLGKYHGKYSFDAFSHEKAVYDKSIAVDVGLRYAPRNKKKDAMFEALMNLDILGLIKHYLS